MRMPAVTLRVDPWVPHPDVLRSCSRGEDVCTARFQRGRCLHRGSKERARRLAQKARADERAGLSARLLPPRLGDNPVSALGLLRGVLLCTHLISIANVHASAHAETLAHEVPPDRLAPILDLAKLPPTTTDGRVISRSPAHHLQNCLRKRIDRGEIPDPETVGVSMAMLMRVAGVLAELNRDDLGSWASLTYLSDRCDASPSQIRAAHNYLVAHGHSLRLSRLKADDRKIGGAKRPLVVARTTIRPVFAVTCEMVETLTEEQVLDLIAAGEQRPQATEPNQPREEQGERGGQAEEVPPAGEEAEG